MLASGSIRRFDFAVGITKFASAIGTLRVAALAPFALFVTTVPAYADNRHETEILSKVKTYIEAFYAKDVEAMSSVAAEQFPVTSLRKLDDGDRLTLRPFTRMTSHLDQETAEITGDDWDFRTVISGPLAVVLQRHRLFLNGERQHCGTDVFNLMLIDGEWKITGLQYSMEADGCPEDQD